MLGCSLLNRTTVLQHPVLSAVQLGSSVLLIVLATAAGAVAGIRSALSLRWASIV